MKLRNLRGFLAASLLASLAACVVPPPAVVEPESEPQPPRIADDVQLTLNLPEDPPRCDCTPASGNDRIFLERGMETLADGDYIEAVQHFQRYQRLEKTRLAQWEAELAIAYVSMLPSSPFFDVDAAREAYTDLQSREPDGQKHHSIVLMQQALESFVLMEQHMQELERRAGMLQDDLDKREQALKRLRELTLGQPEGAP